MKLLYKALLILVMLIASGLPLFIFSQIFLGQIISAGDYFSPGLALYQSKKVLLISSLLLWLKTIPIIVIATLAIWLPTILGLILKQRIRYLLLITYILALLAQWVFLGNELYLFVSTALTISVQAIMVGFVNAIYDYFIVNRKDSV